MNAGGFFIGPILPIPPISRYNPAMSDSIAELTAQIQDFVNAREWRKYHNAKDLAVAIAAEAGELMETNTSAVGTPDCTSSSSSSSSGGGGIQS